jgi:hypothetical protein
MNLNEFKDENVIVDPNLKKMLGSQENSNNASKNIVTPQQMGFTHQEPEKITRPEQPILDNLDKAIARKQNEARLLAQAIDEADGEGITEGEFQDILAQAKDELDNIPTTEQLQNVSAPREQFVSTLPTENPTMDLMEELEKELEEDEADYETETAYGNHEVPVTAEPEAVVTTTTEEVKPEPVVTTTPVVDSTNPFTNFVSGDINFDEEDKELEENIDEKKVAEKEQEEQLNKLRTLVREKIKPVSDKFDISTFTIVSRPAATVVNTPRVTRDTVADWVLMSSQKPIYMKRFTGTEMERLSNGGKGRTRLNRAMDTWQLIFDHIVDPNKPASLEEWARTTSFLDIEHIYMAIYRANYEGSNYIPYNCTNENCKDKIFLTDNMDIMDMCKFKDAKAKDKFNSIIGTETIPGSNLYSTELVPVSEDYAFVFREPSIYNIIFESAVLDQEFVDKFGELISICTYIDGIYYINRETRELQPVRVNTYPNNMKKTVKSRIINFSKYISMLNSDQYNTIIAYMQKINETGEELTYQLPEVTCPSCKTTIDAVKQDAQQLVFTRHQLAALANL